MKKLRGYIEKSSDKIRSIRYHHYSNKVAMAALREIESEKGRLTTAQKKHADDYAGDVLGWKGYAPWLYVYTAVKGEFTQGWIPDNYYGKVIIQKIQGDYGKISALKPLCNTFFGKETSPDVASYINGLWFDATLKVIPVESIKDVVFANCDNVICKLDRSGQGRGIFVVNKRDFNANTVQAKGNCVIQKFVRQHAFFDAFVSTAVATIRITTVVDTTNKISVRACYLRLARAKDTHVMSTNHIRIPMSLTDGMLDKTGYLSNWKTIGEHPDSKVSFSDKIVPFYDSCIALVLKLHERMPMVRAIGWDVVVDDQNNPVVMEWNGYSNDIKFSEATQGPCFRDLSWNPFYKTDTTI